MREHFLALKVRVEKKKDDNGGLYPYTLSVSGYPDSDTTKVGIQGHEVGGIIQTLERPEFWEMMTSSLIEAVRKGPANGG